MSFSMNGSNRTARRCWLRTGPGSSHAGLPSEAQPPAKQAARARAASMARGAMGTGEVTDVIPKNEAGRGW